MIILQDEKISHSKFLLPVLKSQWRSPSQSLAKDCFGNEDKTLFKIMARLNDGYVIWEGWFEDRDDFDAFLCALNDGTLKSQKELWSLATPSWQPYMGEDLTYEFATVTILTSNAGSNQTYVAGSDWNPANNTIECLGGGGSGGLLYNESTQQRNTTGGGGGGYAKQVNLNATGSITYQIGLGGAFTPIAPTLAAAYNGNTGGDTWFNGTTYAGATTGATGGGAGAASTATTGTVAGGAAGSGKGTTTFTGGRGGNITASATTTRVATGGGGAAGTTGTGAQGVDATTAANLSTNGGAGGATGGGTAGVASTSASGTAGGDGGAGTNWTSVGSGGGGGGMIVSITDDTAAAYRGGNGGNYGAGGGGMSVGTTSVITTGAGGLGRQGLIIITYEPAIKTGLNMPMLGL